MLEYFYAGITILFATYTLGYVIAAANYLEKKHVLYFERLFIIFYVGKWIRFLPRIIELFVTIPETPGIFLILGDQIFEILLYGYLLFFLHSFFGIITLRRIIIIAVLYCFGWISDMLEAILREMMTGGLFIFIDNISSLPLLGYICYIAFKHLHEISDKLLRRLLVYSGMILGSVSIVILIDGFLEAVANINLPKDALYVIVYCLLSLLYLRSIKVYFSSGDSSVLSRYISDHGLTRREAEIVSYLIEGHSYKSIAYELSISIATVKTHVHNIYSKTGQESRFTLLNSIRTL